MTRGRYSSSNISNVCGISGMVMFVYNALPLRDALRGLRLTLLAQPAQAGVKPRYLTNAS